MSKLKHILYLLAIITLTYSQTVIVASTSSKVAATKCNYTFTVSNITNIASTTISFTDWGFFINSPVDTINTKAYINGQLANIIHANGLSVVSYSPNFGSSQSFTIVLTNMLNPPSTKPYLMNLTFSRGSAPTTLVLSTYLTINTINHQLTFTIRQNNRNVGATTSTASFDFDSVNYFDNNTLLSLVFDSSKINITFPSSSSYTISQGSGRINISKMSFTMSNTLSFSSVTITNPKAALTYVIDVQQFFIEASTKYVYAVANTTVTLLPIAFTTLSIASPLSMGSLVSLNVSSSCNFPQVNSPNETAYTYITVDSNMDLVSGSDCSSISSTQCKHIKSGSTYFLTNFRPKINSSNTTITFTSYTYFLSAFYELCTGQATVNFTTQKIAPYIISSECNGNSASNLNSINIYSVVESAAEGDIVYMAIIKGVIINSLLWRTETVNSTTYLKFIVSNSTISTNGTKQLLKLPLVYSNPNQTSTNTFSDFYIQRGTTKYAIITNSPVAVCNVITAKQVSFSSSFTTSLITYQLMNLTLSYSYQIFDYAYNDYIIIEFKSLGGSKQYVLGGSLLGKNLNLTVNGVYCSFSILNDTTIKIIQSNNITLPTSNASACTILIYNLVNPPLVDTYWTTLTTYDFPTGGMKETFDSTQNILIANTLTYSIANLNLLKQNSLTLSLSGTNRNILSKNMSNPFTLLTILIPTQLNCPNFPNNTISFNWSSALPTSTSFATVNSSAVIITLGSCFASYFIGAINFSISEKVGTAISTSTTASVANTCGDDCFQCSSSACTACFNSSFNPKILLFGNSCYSNCPSGSYLTGSTCTKCYGSCATCTGGSYNQCSTCITNFQLNSSTCLSICGTGKYSLDGVCINCHENCNHCISATNCYICKENAVLLGQTCEFSSCSAPCSTCSGTITTCTSCTSGKYLYLSQCYDSCPTGTYKVGGACSAVSESASFFPVTITGLLCLIIVFLIRRFANSKIGNASRRSLSYSQSTNRQVNYNINVIRLSFVIFAYLQMVAALVILIKSSIYSLPSAVTTAVAIGLVIHFASNIAFLVGFFRIIYKNRVENNQDDVRLDGQRQFSMKSTSFKVIMILSILFSFKTFKLLFANLLIDRQGLTATQISDNKKQIDESQNNLVDLNIVRVPNFSKMPQQPKITLGSGRSRHRSQIKKEDDIIPSRKPIRSNSFDDSNNIEINRTDSLRVPNPQDSELKKIQKSFQCFLNGLTLINLCSASLAILVGCILIALIPDAIPVVFFHGLDCLVVTAISLGLTVFDTWSFNCLKVDEQSSEMESKGEVNNTHENLKQQAGLDIKIQPDRKTSRSTKKITSMSKPKMSQRSQKSLEKDGFSLEGVKGGIKRECDEETVARNEKLPDLKMFQADFDEQDDNVINQKKTKKFSTKNLQGIKRMGSRRNQSNSHRRSQGGSMFDDLFINFNAEEKITNNANPTTKYASRRSLSPQHSLREGSIKLQDDIEQRAPNFTDISDIEDDVPDQVNASIASELINMNFTKQSNPPTEKQ